MTTIDKIRAEIERRIEWLNTATGDFAEGRRAELRSLLSFLDTMPDEPVTDCHDLTEAADEHIRKVVDAAGHPGWEWETRDIKDAFKAGAEWMKRKMMEGAVEGVVCATITGTNAISFLSPLPKELKACDEVSIIILPKEVG